MKNLNHKDAHDLLGKISQIENMAGLPALSTDHEDYTVNIRLNEDVGPAMFKPDPLIPNGYIANSLTIRAMRPDLFVLGSSLDDFSENYECACGKEFDLQFWKLCPYCARDIKK